MQKLILMLAFVYVMTVGKSTLLFGADHTHTYNPKLESAQHEQPAPPEAISRRANADPCAPTHTSAQEELEQMEKRCSWDVAAAVGCQPPPGSSLSAFPLVSHTSPPPEGNQQ